jgi:hypothetical protein
MWLFENPCEYRGLKGVPEFHPGSSTFRLAAKAGVHKDEVFLEQIR